MTSLRKQEQRVVARLIYPGTPYAYGYDAGRNGANTENCHFTIFSSPERTKEWERGNNDGSYDRIREEAALAKMKKERK